MRRTFCILLVILAIALSTGAHAAEQLSLFGAQLTYTNPNPQVWHKDAERRESAKGPPRPETCGPVRHAGEHHLPCSGYHL